jgi:3-(3-hydroxy-phenyl)propionate hydroxylase
VFPTRVEESDEEALGDESTYSRLQRVFPLNRRYNVVHRNLYKVHQRVAATFRKGRVFLAGDSAHVNNSVGGLGLNGGIHDAMELVDALHQVITKQAADALLDRYTRRRRTLNVEFVQAQTINNKKRLEEGDPKARQARFDELRATAEDPHKHKEFLLRTSLIASAQGTEHGVIPKRAVKIGRSSKAVHAEVFPFLLLLNGDAFCESRRTKERLLPMAHVH